MVSTLHEGGGRTVPDKPLQSRQFSSSLDRTAGLCPRPDRNRFSRMG
ncbi:hypothetical protein SXCC_00362 [Gluconacetobacter sp. SXCC-1]|nr:hypothetical protein SXCC_00362 [Gluconacetobacter sp. SXCC-1]